MTIFRRAKSEVVPWIGLIHVKPLPEHAWALESIGGAYASVVVLASSRSEFIASVEKHVRDLDLYLVEAEDIEPLRERLLTASPDDALLEAASRLNTRHPVAIDVFDLYPLDEGEQS